MMRNRLALLYILASFANAQENPCIVCPDGVTADEGEDYKPYASSGDFTTCAEFIEAYELIDSGSPKCGMADLVVGTFCCYTPPENPCTICPNGVTADEGDDYVPYADDGDTMTCAQYIELAAWYESGSYVCGYFEIDELSCCPTEPEDACIICPNGATVGDDFVPYDASNSTTTCIDLIDGAMLFETESSFCGGQGEMVERHCCPSGGSFEATTTTADNPCIICPDGATADDDFAPYRDSGNPMTCNQLINAAESYEADSEWCESREVDAAYCCPTVPVNPCIICPYGAFAGDDFVPRPLSGSSKTCKEIIDFARLFESGSRQCKLSEEDETLCCPLVPALITTPSSNPTGANPIDPTPDNSGGAIAGAVIAVVSVVAIALGVYYLRKKGNHTISSSIVHEGPTSSATSTATSAAFFTGDRARADDPQRVEDMPGGVIPTAMAIRIGQETDESEATHDAAIPPNDPNHPFVRAMMVRLRADWADAGVPTDKQTSMEIYILRTIAKLPFDATPADQARMVASALSELADTENDQFPVEPPPPPSAPRLNE
ncbi:hypothetical protein ACHAXA_005470 [Cyclostephanos tholiformis]|uniref:Uncharacterized protein n=1 Tax=Cyclostephanos tholiformis TaxID=382380 RepID=A0ABD3SHY0_9STRA